MPLKVSPHRSKHDVEVAKLSSQWWFIGCSNWTFCSLAKRLWRLDIVMYASASVLHGKSCPKYRKCACICSPNNMNALEGNGTPKWTPELVMTANLHEVSNVHLLLETAEQKCRADQRRNDKKRSKKFLMWGAWDHHTRRNLWSPHECFLSKQFSLSC